VCSSSTFKPGVTPQRSLQHRAERLPTARWTSLCERADVVLLEELLTVHQDEGNVLQNQPLALLDVAFDLIALLDKNLNYLKLRIWIFQFGHDFIEQMVAEHTRAVTSHTGEKSRVPAQAIPFAERFRSDLRDLGKQESRIRVHQLDTLLFKGE